MKYLTLQQILKIASCFAYKAEDRYNIMGVNIDYNGDTKLTACATNGHCLIKIEADIEKNNGLPQGQYTLNKNSVNHFMKILNVMPETQLYVGVNDKINLDFPNINNVIKDWDKEVCMPNIDPKYLGLVAKVGKEVLNSKMHDGIALEVTNEKSPTSFYINSEHYKIRMLVMSMGK